MSIATELTLLANSKQAIKNSINAKGGSVTDSTPLADYSTAIDNLPSGGDDSALIDLIERDITSINIPSGTTSIGNYAFYYCSSLSSVTFPSSVTSIGNRAFQGCTNLFKNSTLTIPSTITSIGTYAFADCDIKNIVIQNGITEIPNYAFYWSSTTSRRSLNSITIPNGITTIGQYAFHGFNSIESLELTIPDSVTSIGDFAFSSGSSLLSKGYVKKLTIGTGITTIGTKAFNGSSDSSGAVMDTLIIKATTPPTIQTGQYTASFKFTSDAVIYVPASALDDYKSDSNWSTYADRIYAITQVATVDGNPVYNYDIGNTDSTVISDDERSNIPTGDVLEFSEGVTQIGGQLGAYEEVILPSTFTSFIDTQPINAATTTLTSNATTPPSVERNNLGGSGLTAVYVPAASVDTYKAASAWSSFESIIQAIGGSESEVTSITFSQFNGETNPVDFGDIQGCDETVNLDAFVAESSSSTFDDDVKANGIAVVFDNNDNDITSQCTFDSSDYYKWDSTQDASYDGESEAFYEWRLDTYVTNGDSSNGQSAEITATYGSLSDTLTIDWTTTSNCEPEPEEEVTE